MLKHFVVAALLGSVFLSGCSNHDTTSTTNAIQGHWETDKLDIRITEDTLTMRNKDNGDNVSADYTVISSDDNSLKIKETGDDIGDNNYEITKFTFSDDKDTVNVITRVYDGNDNPISDEYTYTYHYVDNNTNQ